MLPPLTLGRWPARSIDFGVYSPNDLTDVLTELNLIKRRVEQGKRAAEARDQVANGIRPPLSSTNRKRLNELTAAYRYSASPTVDLSWVPIWVFLGLVEKLTPQQVTFLAMSRGAFLRTVFNLWPRPVPDHLAQAYFHDLLPKHPTRASRFHAEISQSRVHPTIHALKRYHDGTTKPSGHRPLSSLANPSSMPYQTIEPILQRAQVEHPFALKLLSMIQIWGGEIPRMMVDRVGEPRKDWSDDGEVKEVMLDPVTVSEFTQAPTSIHWLQSHDLLEVKEHGDRYTQLSIPPSVSRYLQVYMAPSDESKVLAIMLVCHLFPGDKDIEPL
ncbi:hypothetical protein DL98DRAFT_257397 [Cadophora sp. DSE1049]|nr:hypothetical protein DL98DRAFT_257397 [Cadophora sp. DSE1049]